MITLKDFSPDNIPTQKQVDLLAQFLIENFESEIGGNKAGEGAIEMAVRLLLELKIMRLYHEDKEEIPQFKGTREALKNLTNPS